MNNSFKIDEITCNDINIDQLYSLTNFTKCRVGGEYLYNALINPVLNETILIKRDRLCEELSQNVHINKSLDKALEKLGNDNKLSVYSCFSKIEDIPRKNILPNIFFSLLLAAVFILMLICDSKVLLFTFFALIPINMVYYFICKGKIVQHICVFKFIINLLKNSKHIIAIQGKHISEYTTRINSNLKIFDKTKRFSFCLLAGKNATGSFLDLILEYLRMLFHIDIIKFYSMLGQLKRNKSALIAVLDDIGELDMASSIIKFRQSLPYYCKPEFTDELMIDADEIYHPYLKNPVSNSIGIDKSILITGSNATGKSTFIRTLGINAILAQSLYTCTSKKYIAPMFRTYSSMMITDNILHNESYFVAEIKSIKRMTDLKSNNGYKLLLMDELLRGTNSNERLTATGKILKYLTDKTTLCIVATHDITLTNMLSEEYDHYYFNEKIQDDILTFDYKLKKGVCRTTNALKLLKSFGFPEEIWRE